MNKERVYIYESPDGGKTIFRREFGSSDREQMNNIKTTTDDPYGHREFRKQQIEYKKFWTCKICKRDTSAVEYDYLVSHNLHLECALKEELKHIKSDEKKCPHCKAEL